MNAPSSRHGNGTRRGASWSALGLRLGVICLVAGLIQLAVGAFSVDEHVPVAIQRLDDAIASRADVVFFGDSTVFFTHPEDADKSSIPTFLQGLTDELSVVAVYSAAFDPQLYADFAQYMRKHGAVNRFVVFPINLRLYAPQLNTYHYRYFDKERLFLKNDSVIFRWLYGPLSTFKTFNFRSVSEKDFAMAPVLDGEKNLGPVGIFNPLREIEVDDTQRARIITFFFMYSLKPDDPAPQALKRMVKQLAAAGITAVPYFTPVDMASCREALGSQFDTRIEENLAVLRGLLEELEVDYLDLSSSLGPEFFAWTHYPNDHLKDSGRKYVAERIFEHLSRPRI